MKCPFPGDLFNNQDIPKFADDLREREKFTSINEGELLTTLKTFPKNSTSGNVRLTGEFYSKF